jgi:hypothetical protein
MSVIKRLDILPNYTTGFTFVWEMQGDFVAPAPWIFTIQQSQVFNGPWTTISPGLTNVQRWTDNTHRAVSKDAVLYFRVTLTTPKTVYYSDPVAPYGEVNRREWLIIKDIMRREVLQARTLAGVTCRIWIRSVVGAKCTVCLDPVTGGITNSACPSCFGVGKVPPYHGPYDAWCTFTPKSTDTVQGEGGAGTRQPVSHQVRMVVAPYMKDGDIVIDVHQDKRYYVDQVAIQTELRRVPIVQVLTCHEAPVTEPIYKLGS